MDFNSMLDNEKRRFAELMFTPLTSAEEVRDWVRLFLGLEIPLEITDPESNSTPLDAIFQIYNTLRTNSGDVNPGYVLLSCREGMKTVSVAILEVLTLLHCQLDIAHASATETQSSVCLQYIEDFFLKIGCLMEIMGWKNLTQNKRTCKFHSPSGKTPFIKVVICSPKGMNSLHSNVLFLDELDLADPASLKEGVNIVGFSKGIYGIKVYLSTRKYAFGNMAKMIEQTPEKNYKVLRWNILDVTERCPETRHKPELPKEDRYVAKSLPLKQISAQEYNDLAESERVKFDLIKGAFGGCVDCKLLPVCRTRLSKKSATATGGFYKPIVSVKQQFTDNDPDIGEAQLMCWRPGSTGLVYPRFSPVVDKGNVISLKAAHEKLLGYMPTHVSESSLLTLLKSFGIPISAGVDWGFTHEAVIVLFARFQHGEVWLLDCFSSPGLEFSDMLDIAIKFNERYEVQRWFCDTAYPANVKSFNKNGLKSPKFVKDVAGGIEAVRSKIVNASGHRFFQVLDTPNCKKAIHALSRHRFQLDTLGNPTTQPDDEVGIADICDAIRYGAQNLFPVKGSQKPGVVYTESELRQQPENPAANEQMRMEVLRRCADDGFKGGSGKKGGFHFSI